MAKTPEPVQMNGPIPKPHGNYPLLGAEPTFPDHPMTPTKTATFDDSEMEELVEVEGKLEITSITGQSLWMAVLAVVLICTSILAAGAVVAKAINKNTSALLCVRAAEMQTPPGDTLTSLVCKDGNVTVTRERLDVEFVPPVASVDGEFY